MSASEGGERPRNTRAFCAQAIPAINKNGAVLSESVLDRAALGEEWVDYAGLEEFLTDYRTLGEGLEDTLLALGSDSMVACIFGVGFLKALNKVDPSLDDLLRELKAARRRPPQKKAKPAPKLKASRRRRTTKADAPAAYARGVSREGPGAFEGKPGNVRGKLRGLRGKPPGHSPESPRHSRRA